MLVDEICTRQVETIMPSSSVSDAAKQMRSRHVGSLVVVAENNSGHTPVGILTDRDIVVSVVAAGLHPEVITVGDVMSQPVISCSEKDDVFDAILMMRKNGVRRLPVLDKWQKLSGVVAVDDIWTVLVEQLGILGRALSHEQAVEMERRV